MALIERFERKANDWQVTPRAQVGAAKILGAVALWCDFESHSQQVKEQFAFFALAFGGGGNLGGASLGLKPTPIKCDVNFSVYDLHNAGGRVGILGGSLAVGPGVVTITAWTQKAVLFEAQEIYGWSAGVGLIGISSIGIWRSTKLFADRASRDVNRELNERLRR